MQELSVEWRHYDKEGTICDLCAATGKSVREVVAGLTKELASRGIAVTFTETKLLEDLVAQSNMILFNGVPLEVILENASADENHCSSYSCLTGSKQVAEQLNMKVRVMKRYLQNFSARQLTE